MLGLQIDKNIEAILSQPQRKIDKKILLDVCKIRQCEKTCRYIMLGPIGFVCVKNTRLKKAIDSMREKNMITAKSDNCDGLGECECLEQGSQEKRNEGSDA